LLRILPITRRASPAKTVICAEYTRFNRYKEVPIERSTMPGSRVLRSTNSHPRKIIAYAAAAAVIVLAVYYLPNYFFVEKATADHAVLLLNSIGMRVETRVISENVYLAQVKIVKDCTGVQVIAVFFGLIIPIPGARLGKKLLALLVVSALLYVANVLRIALEFSLLYLGILPWSLAHYPLSFLLGIIGVLALVFVCERLLPEFGDFLFSVVGSRTSLNAQQYQA
jgi:exosortase/archaeosortase family protein